LYFCNEDAGASLPTVIIVPTLRVGTINSDSLKRIEMIKISEKNESRLASLAAITGKSVDDFIEILLENYQDELDIKEAEQVLQESGGISLSELKNKYGL
jgi:hypothetical protein